MFQYIYQKQAGTFIYAMSKPHHKHKFQEGIFFDGEDETYGMVVASATSTNFTGCGSMRTLGGGCYVAEGTDKRTNRQTDGQRQCLKPLLCGGGLITELQKTCIQITMHIKV